VVWDLGCNSGLYSETALRAGAEYVVGFDSDHGALSRAVQRSVGSDLKFLPLLMMRAIRAQARDGIRRSEPG
jgi:ribosomal protein L11 methylase PrmA